MHEKTKTPYAYNAVERKFLGFEDPVSLAAKVSYAKGYNLGGMMIWALDQDDDADTMLSVLSNGNLCGHFDPFEVTHRCLPTDEKRWWTPEDGNGYEGMCGKSAPLINEYYPVCDPEDPGYSCCGAYGYCGSGPDFCDCPTCKNYGNDPSLMLEEPVKPTRLSIAWYTMSDGEGKWGRCGRPAPPLNGNIPICNPDDANTHCCSSSGYCGTGQEFCECDGCGNFLDNPDYVYPPKKWWDWEDGPDKSGRCGPSAPLLDDGGIAECNADSADAHCCSPSGWYGTGADFCECDGCTDFSTK